MKRLLALSFFFGIQLRMYAQTEHNNGDESEISTLLITTVIGLCSAAVLAILNSFLQWYMERRKEKKVKAAELIAPLVTYIDYMITLSWFDIIALQAERKEADIKKLIELKSDTVRSEALLAAYDFSSYELLHTYVSEAIDKDTEISNLIIADAGLEPETDPDEELDRLNERLCEMLKELKETTADIMK